jgi:uncharacterized protein YegP (UPF0339 family)
LSWVGWTGRKVPRPIPRAKASEPDPRDPPPARARSQPAAPPVLAEHSMRPGSSACRVRASGPLSRSSRLNRAITGPLRARNSCRRATTPMDDPLADFSVRRDPIPSDIGRRCAVWRYEVYPDVGEKYRRRLRAEDGETVATSGESFASGSNAVRAAWAIERTQTRDPRFDAGASATQDETNRRRPPSQPLAPALIERTQASIMSLRWMSTPSGHLFHPCEDLADETQRSRLIVSTKTGQLHRA